MITLTAEAKGVNAYKIIFFFCVCVCVVTIKERKGKEERMKRERKKKIHDINSGNNNLILLNPDVIQG